MSEVLRHHRRRRALPPFLLAAAATVVALLLMSSYLVSPPPCLLRRVFGGAELKYCWVGYAENLLRRLIFVHQIVEYHSQIIVDAALWKLLSLQPRRRRRRRRSP